MEVSVTNWPALARVFLTWSYALNRALEETAQRRQKTYVYQGVLDGRVVWVVALDPKGRHSDWRAPREECLACAPKA